VKVAAGDTGGRGLVVAVKVEIDRKGVLVGVPFWFILGEEDTGPIGAQPERKEIKPMAPVKKIQIFFRIAITGKTISAFHSSLLLSQIVLIPDYKPTICISDGTF